MKTRKKISTKKVHTNHHKEPIEWHEDIPERDTSLTEPELIMGEAVEHLQGRQRDVYVMAMRQGLSNTQIGKILNISRDTVQVYKERAIKFVTQFCQSQWGRLEDSNESGC